MPGLIKGKQLEDATIKPAKVDLTVTWDFSSGTIRGGAPVGGTDLTNKTYVDNLIKGLSWKTGVFRASSTNVVIATGTRIGDTFDGFVLVGGERLLLYGQTTVAENGIYLVSSVAATPASRADDADTTTKLLRAAVIVGEGTDANNAFTQTGDGATFATVSTWVRFGAITPASAGAGLSESSGVLNVNAGDGISLTTPTADSVNVDVSALVGEGVENDGSNNFRVKLDGDSISRSASGIKAATPTKANKRQTPSATAGDNATTGLTIAATPAGDGYVSAEVNGVQYEVGDGVKTKNFYYSADGGATARTIAAIVATDVLYFNGTITGFDIETTDRISQNYNVIV